MSTTPDKCPQCGAIRVEGREYACGFIFREGVKHNPRTHECLLNSERTAHAATKLELENTKTDLELAKMSITTLKNRVEELEAQIRQDNRKQAQADAKEWDLEEGWKDHERFQP